MVRSVMSSITAGAERPKPSIKGPIRNMGHGWEVLRVQVEAIPNPLDRKGETKRKRMERKKNIPFKLEPSTPNSKTMRKSNAKTE